MPANAPGTAPRPVRRLPPELARKIAAGEVIDRPNAIIRELLDNAVDAGASSIIAETDGGGIDRVRVVDNGCGMTKADLENAAQPHATSKITEEADLLNISTLGFRGEALASIAAVSRLTVTSVRAGETPWELRASLLGYTVVPANLAEGAIVMSESLFENIPARRNFLKRPQSEGALCKQTFAEKALPKTGITFRLLMDGRQRLALPAGQSLAERFVSAFEYGIDPRLLYELHVEDTERPRGEARWKCTILIGEPSVYRADRKYLFVYANGHRITEYTLMQAIEYGCQGYFPNGTHPVACLLLDIAPDLVDFNIHPAKREARFRDISPIHHGVSIAVRSFFQQQTIAEHVRQTPRPAAVEAAFDFPERVLGSRRDSPPRKPAGQHSGAARLAALAGSDNARAAVRYSPDPPALPDSDFRYLGTALGVFLIVEKDDALYLIDQHAAHERLLYNRFIAHAGESQGLLIPYVVETQSPEEDACLESILEGLRKAGFEGANRGDGRWEFSSVPACWEGSEEDLRRDLLEERLAPDKIVSALAATTACRAAIKEGHVLDSATAEGIIRSALALETPRCPHGRPVWFVLSRAELYRQVRRTE